MYKIVEAIEAVKVTKDSSTVAIGGTGAEHAMTDTIIRALGDYYLQIGQPHNLTVIHPCGISDNDSHELNHLTYKGLIESDIGGFGRNAPKKLKAFIRE